MIQNKYWYAQTLVGRDLLVKGSSIRQTLEIFSGTFYVYHSPMRNGCMFELNRIWSLVADTGRNICFDIFSYRNKTYANLPYILNSRCVRWCTRHSSLTATKIHWVTANSTLVRSRSRSRMTSEGDEWLSRQALQANDKRILMWCMFRRGGRGVAFTEKKKNGTNFGIPWSWIV